jgi:predicted Ser/Thr protein kinase
MMRQHDPRRRESTTARRARPAFLQALGRDAPPQEVTVDGVDYRRAEVFKHDSWAATALYVAASSDAAVPKIVCKFNRKQSLLGLPAAWIGRRLARREAHFLQRLSDSSFVPRLLGTVVVNGRAMDNAVARAFVEGRTLGHCERVGDDFFVQLAAALRSVHARGIAYVDLHKHENVLVGRDGRPYLFDFQVAVDATFDFRLGVRLGRNVVRCMQRMDEFNFIKLHRRSRPDQCPISSDELASFRPWFINLHRLIAEPLRTARRRLLVLLGVRAGRGKVESERFVEIGLREASAKAA